MADTCAASLNLRIVPINDDPCKESLCLVGDAGISGLQVARDFDRLMPPYGKLPCSVSGSIMAMSSRAFLKCNNEDRVDWHWTSPRMPPHNAFVGLLPHKLRSEESFHGRADVRSALAVGH